MPTDLTETLYWSPATETKDEMAPVTSAPDIAPNHPTSVRGLAKVAPQALKEGLFIFRRRGSSERTVQMS